MNGSGHAESRLKPAVGRVVGRFSCLEMEHLLKYAEWSCRPYKTCTSFTDMCRPTLWSRIVRNDLKSRCCMRHFQRVPPPFDFAGPEADLRWLHSVYVFIALNTMPLTVL
jgi:hypothetical protein